MSDSPYILVVEDDPDTRQALLECLREEGHRVVAVAHGGEALELLAISQPPCLIVLDQWMPVVDGPTFLAELRADTRYDQVAILLLSANRAWPGVTLSAKLSLLQKPVRLEALLDAVAEHC